MDSLPEINATEGFSLPDTTETEPVKYLSDDEHEEPKQELPEMNAEGALPEMATDGGGLPTMNDPVDLPQATEEALPVDTEEALAEAPGAVLPGTTEEVNEKSAEAKVLDSAKQTGVTEIQESEAPSGKRKLEAQEKSRKKQKVVQKAAGSVLEISLSVDEVQSLMDLKQAAVNANRSFYTVDALLFACKKAMEDQPDFDHTTGLRIQLQLLPTHLTYQQLIQFRAQLLCHRLLVRNMQPPDRVLHTARGGYNKKEVEYAEFRRNLLPNVPETIHEMNEYDKQSRIELANRRAKFWTELHASGY